MDIKLYRSIRVNTTGKGFEVDEERIITIRGRRVATTTSVRPISYASLTRLFKLSDGEGPINTTKTITLANYLIFSKQA